MRRALLLLACLLLPTSVFAAATGIVINSPSYKGNLTACFGACLSDEINVSGAQVLHVTVDMVSGNWTYIVEHRLLGGTNYIQLDTLTDSGGAADVRNYTYEAPAGHYRARFTTCTGCAGNASWHFVNYR